MLSKIWRQARDKRDQKEPSTHSAGPGRGRSYGLCMRIALAALGYSLLAAPAFAGGPDGQRAFRILPPIVRQNLAIFPVVSSQSYDTSQLITLDEGVRSGQVTVTEAGAEPGLIRPGQPMPPRREGAEVNRLVLYNNSSHALLLLAGEIVTGGKQDRVIGSDRIVPPNTGPIDLGVFCVEPGRWVASSEKFGSMGAQMAQPSVRTPAMAEHNQSQVWANVRSSNARMANNLSSADAAQVAGTSSYAKVFASPPVAKIVGTYGGQDAELSILRELRGKGAVGVVVAVNGQVLWADVFASTELLAKYWPKLMRSYVAEAMTSANSGVSPDTRDAQLYMDDLGGGREIVETEPSVYRRTDVTGNGYRVFELMSLLPKTGFIVHITKMRQ
ncbi:MAG: ARPP-1 family domain-containing protein [Terracidiphilus sp.]